MSLATRCTACGTIFKVVQDQLRVSDGWVRCGRCAEVFDAREQLFDIEQEPPPPWHGSSSGPAPFSAPAAMPEPVVEPQIAPAPEPELEPDAVLEASAAAEPDAQAAPAALEPINDQPLTAEVEAGSMSAHAEDRIEPTFSAAPIEPAVAPEAAPESIVDSSLSEPISVSAEAVAVETPSFVRRAQARERWRRPGVRVALATCCLLTALALALQMSWQFRDAIASLWPQTAPTLRTACEALGCEIQAWRRIDAISVEQSALNQAGAGNQYRLSLTLRNKSGQNLALPWIDLSLTDLSGQIVTRRMLAPRDFNTKSPLLMANSEQALQVVFSTGEQRVSGYTVEIFHP